MFIHIEKAQYIAGYQIWLSFNDGAQGVIDLKPELHGDIFEPLKDIDYFKHFKLEGHTLSWPNGADFAPEFLREHSFADTNSQSHTVI